MQKTQIKILGQEYQSFDVYNYRGSKLLYKLESYLKSGKVSTLLFSNPNNPSWICFTEEELEIIGTLAKKYDVIVIEDLAYFGMDYRNDCSVPGVAPFQPSVSKYCDDYIILISGSKAFSYAGHPVSCARGRSPCEGCRAPPADRRPLPVARQALLSPAHRGRRERARRGSCAPRRQSQRRLSSERRVLHGARDLRPL